MFSAGKVDPGVYRIGTPRFNWYLVEADGRLTVIDAGLPNHFLCLRRLLKVLDRQLDEVDAIVLTQTTWVSPSLYAGYPEPRCGCTNRIRIVWRAQKPSLGIVMNVWRPSVIRMGLEALRSGVSKVPEVGEYRTFRHGQILEVPGLLRVIHTPGHTEGHCALHLEQSGILFSGDALITANLLTGEPSHPRVPYRYSNADFRQAYASLDRLGDLGRVTLLPGHGEAWAGEARDAVRAAQAAKA